MIGKILSLIVLTTPTFNEGAFKGLVTSWSEPITRNLLWAIPAVTIVSCLASGLIHFLRDEEDRQQKPIVKTIKRNIYIGVGLLSLNAILKIFGF